MVGPPINVETTVAPAHHVFDNHITDLAFGFEHLEHFAAKQLLHVCCPGYGCDAEGACVRKTAAGGDYMQVRVELLKIAEGVHGYGSAGHGRVTGTALTEVGLERFPVAAAQFGQQFTVEQNINDLSNRRIDDSTPTNQATQNLQVFPDHADNLLMIDAPLGPLDLP